MQICLNAMGLLGVSLEEPSLLMLKRQSSYEYQYFWNLGRYN